MIQKRVTVGRTAVEKPDDLDILSAIWILSCNDEDGVMTYRGTAYRLGIDESAARRIVRSRTELFRPGVPQFWLDEWKESIKSRKWLPSWYVAITDTQERAAALESIKANDAFRNQFRADRGSGRCDILGIYQFSSAPQSCGRGRQDWISLTMRRSPRVNQEVLLRATFLG